MITLEDITFLDYYSLDEEKKREYDYAIKYAIRYNTPRDFYGIGDFMKISFGLVKDLQYDIEKGLSWSDLFDYIEKLTGKRMETYKLLIICQTKAYIVKSIEEIIEVESIALKSDISQDEEEAGLSEEFEGLGIQLQVTSLTGGDITKRKTVMGLPYEECFIELVTKKKLNDYNHRLQKIRQRKSGND